MAFMARNTFTLAVLWLAAACGSANQQNRTRGPVLANLEPERGQPGVTCRTERPTGSFIYRRVCRYDDEMEHARQTAIDYWQRPRISPERQD
jgi:hypothetical protein